MKNRIFPCGIAPVLILIIFLVIFSLGCGKEIKENSWSASQQTPESANEQTIGVKNGDLAPDFNLADTINGDGLFAQSLSDLRGKVVLLNFWASWCVYCDKEMPSLQSLAETFHGTDFVLLGINDGEGKETARKYVEGKKLTFPIVLDQSQNITKKYQVRSIPVTFLLNKRGEIVTVIIGALDWSQPAIRDTIIRLLEE